MNLAKKSVFLKYSNIFSEKTQNIQTFVRACLIVSNIFYYSFRPLFQYSLIPVSVYLQICKMSERPENKHSPDTYVKLCLSVPIQIK